MCVYRVGWVGVGACKGWVGRYVWVCVGVGRCGCVGDGLVGRWV